ncbi:MAG: right-handed parallel beta-helix repeat-containing protein, partial [Treponemataceae bacterium]|nr:right-handed parallel beta-helix repeat-containing protein [Treponemataceae bacterium]
MNNKNLILFFLIISILFTTIGCSDFYGDLSTDLRFKIDLNGLQLNRRSRTQTTEPAKLSVELTSKDNLVTLKQEQDIITNTTNYFTFENIEVGTTIKITATLFEDEKETYFDETKWFLVKPTDNYISLVLKKTATLTFIDDYDDSFYRELIGIIGNKITTTIKPPIKPGYTFNGWEPELPDYFPESNTTYIAQWEPINKIETWEELNTQILGITDNSNPVFVITNNLTATETIIINKPVTLTTAQNIQISRNENFSEKFFNISSGGSLELKGTGNYTITIDGDSSSSTTSNGGAVFVSDSGTFTMKDNVIIQSCKAENGGAVYVTDSGTFEMTGGTITNCEATNDGGAVYITNGGSFEMTGGTIQNCEASLSGGGVWMNCGSSFTMSGNSKIEECTANSEGGGVYATDANNPCSFTMKDNATITGCTAQNYGGGGVSYGCGTTNALNKCFSMEGGTISNCSSSDGGGVYLYGCFEMNGGIISGNTASNGAGVYIRHGSSSFTMEDGSISDNKASGKGGGVYLSDYSSSFTMKDGIIGKEIKETDSTKSSWEYAATEVDGEYSNYAGEGGGGIYAENGTVSIEGGKISYNYVPDPDRSGTPSSTQLKQGGGIFIEGGTLTLKNAEVSYNRGYQGGGVRCSGTDTGFVSELKLDNATIKGNVGKYKSWSNFGGGLVIRNVTNVDFGTTPSIIEENYSADGGAVFIENTTVTLNNITIQNNKYDTEGYRYGSEVLLWDNANVSINESPDNVKIASNEDETQGICIHADSNGQTNALNLSGNVKLDTPIYLVEKTKINITGDLK